MDENKTTYRQKLRDPRWQKKRLEILNKSQWTCAFCSDTKTTLVVHHLKYLPMKQPWDYPENLLVVLCEDCHSFEHDFRDEMENKLLQSLIAGKISSEQIDYLACLIAGRGSAWIDQVINNHRRNKSGLKNADK